MVSERRVCRVLSQSRTSQRYAPVQREDEAPLVALVVSLACQYGGYGYRIVTGLIRLTGWMVNRNGFRLDGVPVHVVRGRYVEKGRRYSVVVVNLFDRPLDFRTFVPRLLALVPKRGRVVVAYPVEWTREFRRAARAAIPKLKQNRGCWFSAWRIYGRELK